MRGQGTPAAFSGIPVGGSPSERLRMPAYSTKVLTLLTPRGDKTTGSVNPLNTLRRGTHDERPLGLLSPPATGAQSKTTLPCNHFPSSAPLRWMPRRKGADTPLATVAAAATVDIEISEVIEYLMDDEHTRSIAVFAETVRDLRRFAAAAERALAAAKPTVILKMGSSQVAAEAAQAHTGSLVGDDRVVDAMCQRYGLMRVRSIEDLVFTAAFAGITGPFASGGLAGVSMSGGMCEIVAERAEEEGLSLCTLAPPTEAALREILPGDIYLDNFRY